MLGSIQLRRARVALPPAAALMVFGTANVGVAQGATKTFNFTGVSSSSLSCPASPA